MGDPKETHRQDMFDAFLEAAAKADMASFKVFYEEWERCDEGKSGIRLAGLPHPYTAEGFCFHCSTSWTIHGVIFEEDDRENIAAYCQAVHMISACDEFGACYCFTSEKREATVCQMCLASTEKCICGDLSAPGPCVQPVVTVIWAS
jgi:hypothetical protein